jgi:hypothetical protein
MTENKQVKGIMEIQSWLVKGSTLFPMIFSTTYIFFLGYLDAIGISELPDVITSVQYSLRMIGYSLIGFINNADYLFILYFLILLLIAYFRKFSLPDSIKKFFRADFSRPLNAAVLLIFTLLVIQISIVSNSIILHFICSTTVLLVPFGVIIFNTSEINKAKVMIYTVFFSMVLFYAYRLGNLSAHRYVTLPSVIHPEDLTGNRLMVWRYKNTSYTINCKGTQKLLERWEGGFNKNAIKEYKISDNVYDSICSRSLR